MNDTSEHQQLISAAKKRSHRKKKWIISLIIVCLVGGMATGTWYVVTQRGMTQQDSTTTSLPTLTKADLIAKVQALRKDSKTQEAQVLIEHQAYYKDGSFITVMYAEVLATNGHVETGVQVLKDAEKGKANQYYFRGHAADILAQAGKKAEAIAYYTQAIELAKAVQAADDAADDAESLDIGSAISDYEWALKQLGASNE